MLKMDITGKGIFAIFLLKMHIFKKFWSTPPTDVLNSAKLRSVCGGGGCSRDIQELTKGDCNIYF